MLEKYKETQMKKKKCSKGVSGGAQNSKFPNFLKITRISAISMDEDDDEEDLLLLLENER